MFPGLKDGSEGARLAHFLWTHFVAQADYLLDLHSGSYNRWNFPHLRGNMKDDAMRDWARGIDGQVILTSSGVTGSLRKEAGKIGKPVFKSMAQHQPDHVGSDCPMAGHHIAQGMAEAGTPAKAVHHPLALMRIAYGLE